MIRMFAAENATQKQIFITRRKRQSPHGTGGQGMIEYAVLGRFLGHFEALLDNVINETSGKTTETIFREMRDRLDEVMNDE